MTDAELIAILIGSGTPNMSAVDVSKSILASVDHDLHQLAQLTVNDLMKFPGIGAAKAIAVVSAIELGRRRGETQRGKPAKIKSSEDAYKYLRPMLMDQKQEHFWILLLNRANRVIKAVEISAGGVSSTVVDPKIIFSKALDHLASSIILAHNHPSGNLSPSPSDEALTRKLIEAGTILDIPVIDHLIITDSGYTSFSDDGIIH